MCPSLLRLAMIKSSVQKKFVGPLKYFILCSIIVQKTISRTHFENHYYNTAVAFQKNPDMFISPSLKARVQKF